VALAKACTQKCPICKGAGKCHTAASALLSDEPPECMYCKGKGKLGAVKGVTATEVLAARAAGEMQQLSGPLVVVGQVKTGGMTGRWQARVDLQGPGSLHVVRCEIMFQPGVADLLDRLRPGDEIAVFTRFMDPAATLRAEGSVVMSDCWIIAVQ